MKIELTVKKEFDVKFLHVIAEVMYWEDAIVNGKEDDENNIKMPCSDGNTWNPIIELETGRIINWEIGNTASVHYKVCDAGVYTLTDSENNEVVKKDGYVPNCMSPKSNGYGDYIIMDIDGDGMIANWKPDLSDFISEEE